MNNNLSIFKFKSNEVRFVNEKPVANDVAKVLGYADPTSAINRIVDADYRSLVDLQTPSENQKNLIYVLEEAGIYQLIFKSKLKNVKEFQQWIFEEVLPQIRKTGLHSVKQSSEELKNQFLSERSIKDLDEYISMMKKFYGEAYAQRLIPMVMKKFYPDLPIIEPVPEEKASVPDDETLLISTKIAKELRLTCKTLMAVKELRKEYEDDLTHCDLSQSDLESLWE